MNPARQATLPGVRSEDPRIEAFGRFVASLKSSDPKPMLLAMRQLRALGVSVCLTAAYEQEARR